MRQPQDVGRRDTVEPKIYDKVRELCKEQGRSIKEVADAAGIHPKALAKWNDCIPSVLTALRVADVLHVTVEALVR